MRRHAAAPASRPFRTGLAALALTLGLTAAGRAADPVATKDPDGPGRGPAAEPAGLDGEWLAAQAGALGRRLAAWYRATPPGDRIPWAGLIACAFLGLVTALERAARVRRGRVIPRAFRDRFHARLVEGKLDWGKGLDYCELNPSPAARVALAAIKRWGRPAADLERAVTLAKQAEVDRLRRHVGTLRRVAALAPLLGLLGTLNAAGRALAALPAGASWGPAVAASLASLTVGVGLAILALVAYDGLVGRVEAIAGELDRVGAEIVDAIALAAAPAPNPRPSAHQVRVEPAAAPRAPHAVRVEVPERFVRQAEREEEI